MTTTATPNLTSELIAELNLIDSKYKAIQDLQRFIELHPATEDNDFSIYLDNELDDSGMLNELIELAAASYAKHMAVDQSVIKPEVERLFLTPIENDDCPACGYEVTAIAVAQTLHATLTH